MLVDLQLRHHFTEMAVVAHSMGGLLARRVMGIHGRLVERPFITDLVTLVAPMGGMPSADKGVEMAPSVVPSWRDVGELPHAAGSG